MTCLFSCLRQSSHLELPFYTATIFTPSRGRLDTRCRSHTPRKRLSIRARYSKKKKSNGDRKRGAGKEKRERWKRAKDMLALVNLYYLNILQWFLLHRTGRPHSNQTFHTKRVVCVHPHFHIISGQCCNASQIPASPSQTHPILSNRELCKPMQRPLSSLRYSKPSVEAVDKEMQSGSPLTPGSLCKQYGELLGTLLITL